MDPESCRDCVTDLPLKSLDRRNSFEILKRRPSFAKLMSVVRSWKGKELNTSIQNQPFKYFFDIIFQLSITFTSLTNAHLNLSAMSTKEEMNHLSPGQLKDCV